MDAQSQTAQFEYSISKRFEFCASHQLRRLIGTTLPDGREHPCSRRHGHNYVVEIVLCGTTLDDNGFLRDYHDLAPLKEMLDTRFDHQDLNDILQVANPTAEIIARRILRWAEMVWPDLDIEISVEETPKTRATVRLSAEADNLLEQLAFTLGSTFAAFCNLDPDVVATAVRNFGTIR